MSASGRMAEVTAPGSPRPALTKCHAASTSVSFWSGVGWQPR